MKKSLLMISLATLAATSAQANAANLVRAFACAGEREDLDRGRYLEIIREYDDGALVILDHPKDPHNYDDRPDHTVSASAQALPGGWMRYSLIQKNTFLIMYGCGATTQCTVEPKINVRSTIDVNLAHPDRSSLIWQMEFGHRSFKEWQVSRDTSDVWFNRSGRASSLYCVEESRYNNHLPPTLAPGELVQCQDISVNLRKAPVGFKCQTTQGAVFERVDAGADFGEAWKNGDVIWSETFYGPRLRGEGGAYFSDAEAICAQKGGTLPTREQAEKGIAARMSEVVTNIYHTFWTTTLAPAGTTDITRPGDYITYGGKLDQVGSSEPNNAFGAARCVKTAN
jgi:hypothetical protein